VASWIDSIRRRGEAEECHTQAMEPRPGVTQQVFTAERPAGPAAGQHL
jgi:hypothetical protein